MMTNLQIDGLLSVTRGSEQWSRLLQPDAAMHMAPGVLCGIGLTVITSKVQHYLVMPTCMLLLPVVFYAVLFFCGYSVEDARAGGWMKNVTTQEPFYDTWAHFNFERMQWAVLPSLLPTWCGLYLVVAFGSCLDVAAIQLAMGKRLDFNHELRTVGISNVLSGLTGGLTGSYIFSLTVFTFRSNTNSRIPGVMVALLELSLFVVDLDLSAQIPTMFFGTLLIFICVDLMLDWLWYSRTKLSATEYAIVWATFILTNSLGLEGGMAIGSCITLVNFTLSYSGVKRVKFLPTQQGSSVVRGHRQRLLLSSKRSQIVTLQLGGFIFFGNVLSIVKDIETRIRLPEDIETHDEDDTGDGVSEDDEELKASTELGSNLAQAVRSTRPTHQVSVLQLEQSTLGANSSAEPTSPSNQSPASSTSRARTLGEGFYNIAPLHLPPSPAKSAQADARIPEPRAGCGFSDVAGGMDEESASLMMLEVQDDEEEEEEQKVLPTQFVIVDFEDVNGVDATAARSCFLQLKHILQSYGISLLLAGMRPRVKTLLRAHGVITPEMEVESTVNSSCYVFETLDLALEACEERILAQFPSIVNQNKGSHNLLPQVIADDDCALAVIVRDFVEDAALDGVGLGRLDVYFERLELEEAGTVIFNVGSRPQAVFIIETGDVSLYVPASPQTRSAGSDAVDSGTGARSASSAKEVAIKLVKAATPRTQTSISEVAEAKDAAARAAGLLNARRRVQRFKDGGIFGSLDFFNNRRRSFTAETSTPCVIHRLSRESLSKMTREDPALASIVHLVCAKSLCLDVQSKSYLL